MKIYHIITSMQKAAGTTTFVENVVRGLCARGHDAKVIMAEDKFKSCDVIHIHGLWSGLLHKASRFARKNQIPVIWSTHGMTAPWSMHHKWWKKLPAWWLYQRRDLRRAAAVHCTTAQEVEWNRKLGIGKCMVAPLGTEQLAASSQRLAGSREQGASFAKATEVETGNREQGRRLLFVGRVHPVKGLENLIRGWSLCRLLNWQLRIVGPDQVGYQADLEALVAELGITGSVEFVGPKFDAELSSEYANCDCLVLPSFTENFGGVIVDAMAYGKPCIASQFTPWRELSECKCGWWVSNEPQALAGTICEMMSLSDSERHARGERGRKLVEEKYTWDAVVKTMEQAYTEVLNASA